MKHRVDELEGAMLDAAVALAEGYGPVIATWGSFERWLLQNRWEPSASWADAGPIIERENITTIGAPGFMMSGMWEAFIGAYLTENRHGTDVVGKHEAFGPTPLVAAMRCYVRSKFGEFVELPEVAS